MQNTIGVDVSKSVLDAHCSLRGEHRQFPNDASGLAKLVRWSSGGTAIIVFEASGAYHRDLERMLSRRGLTFAKVNPRQARRFAEATGRVAKTDRIDAEMLARMGVALQLEPTALQPEVVVNLRELLVFRRSLIKDRTAAKTRLKTARQAMLRRLLAQRLAQVERQIARVDATMRALIASDARLVERLNILVSIPGISRVSATALLADIPELGSLSGKEAAALAGLAPLSADLFHRSPVGQGMSRQSGPWQGQERIQGGRQSVRQALFMPALSAIQHNGSAKAKFEDLVRAGTPRKVAVTAVMRKLIVLANALLRDMRNWAPEPA